MEHSVDSEFRVSKGKAVMIIVTILFTWCFGFALYELVIRPKPINAISTVMFGGLAGVSWFLLLTMVNRVKFLGSKIHLGSPHRAVELDAKEIAEMQMETAGRSSSVTVHVADGRQYLIANSEFDRPVELMSAFASWWELHGHSDPIWTRRFKACGGPALLLAGAFLFVGGAVAAISDPKIIVLASLMGVPGLLMMAFAIPAFKAYAEVGPECLTIQGSWR